jgi:putative transposase
MTAENRKQRLRRLEFVFVRSPISFVTACTESRRKLLANARLHESFLWFAQQGPLHGAWVGRCMIMPDHIHLFAATDDEKITLSKWMKSFKNSLSKTLRVGCVDAPHWQKTFFDHVLRSASSYSEKWSYVRENPVRAGLVRKTEEWPFMCEVFRVEYHSG